VLVRLLLLSFFLVGTTLLAHNIGVNYAEIDLDHKTDSAHGVFWRLRVPQPELEMLFHLDRDHDGDVSEEELAVNEAQLRDYFTKHVKVNRHGQALSPSIGALELWRDSGDHLYLGLEMFFPYEGKAGDANLSCNLLEETMPGHQTLARIAQAGQMTEFVFTTENSYQITQRSWLVDAGQFTEMGVRHIFTGYDHLAFLIGVILIGGSFSSLLKIVSSFTAAHSLTLALAVFGIVVVPSRIVEAGIALSIMYVAAENLFFQDPRSRWIVTGFFGLIHGFGFANALRDLNLPRPLLTTALFSFNIGVELGQAAIVAVLLPLVWYITRSNQRQMFLTVTSMIVFSVGFYWLIQRVNGS
jgi:hydrogenase/urease accessory protein HupE